MSREAEFVEEFKRGVASFPTGVAVVMGGSREPRGLVVQSFASLSLDPMKVMFAVGHGSRSWPGIEGAGRFSINFLKEGQEDLCMRVARSQATGKFRGEEWRVSDRRIPFLPGSLVTIECAIEGSFPGGDHRIIVGAVLATTARTGQPLAYYRSGFATVSEAVSE